MKDVYKKLLNERVFQKLISTTVSQDFDIRKIQNDIASQLNAESLSDHENTVIRAGKLSEMLRRQGRYVLILDDVWTWFPLKEVGILEPTADNRCKLVLTTRSERIVLSMNCKKVQVPPLSDDEEMKLFSEELGQDVPAQPLKAIMELVVRECDGLPLAIVVVAGCMKGISNPLFWDNALNELRGCKRSLDAMEDKVFGILKFSYDHLGQKDRDCFLYCALYPEDHEINKEEIIEYWMEERLIEEMETRKAMEVNGHSILQKLQENCLLEKVREDTHIKMHDVVRDMALHITRKRFLVKAGMQLKEYPNEEQWSEDLEKVSLMYNYTSTIPQNMKSPKFQKLTTLLLSDNNLEEIPESFFEHFPQLKILDLSYNPIKNLPNSISSLEKLTTLLLVKCNQLKRLPSLLKLQALKKLDLCRSAIEEIPQGLEMLANLRYLDLTTWTSIEMPDGLLPKLCHLQYLAIYPTLMKAEEMKELNMLEVFKGGFSNVGDLNMYAGPRKELYKYFILVGSRDFEAPFYLAKRRSYKTVAFRGIKIDSGDEIILPYDTKELKLLRCKGVRSLNDIRLRDAAAIDLKEYDIGNCDELESVFPSNCHQLQTLESLHLFSLINLKVIVGVGESSAPKFSSLKFIELARCGQMQNLLSADWILPNLEVIFVSDCEKMEEIIVSKEGMGAVTFSLPKLRRLHLLDLPELKGIYSENGVMVCDSLQSIEIIRCPKLKGIPLYLPLLEGKPSPPPSLQEIRVDSKGRWE